ncbi:hypothetical protein PR202_ga21443 [Eleusine coracana subsp. coracana]|uniref:Potassium transporter n=1 Tax=Eleusine coracana subsp. coracana TaxID=191504 RepID=A0AAV5CZ65_ELECO|nr:hypothetical protein PR202_ga21443 [Eleusine coracana subsp. coracana]
MEHHAPDDIVVQMNAAAVAAIDERSSTSQIGDDAGAGNASAGMTRRTFSESYKMRHRNPLVFTKWQVALLSYQSLGVVYGDIGTSPLYTFSSFTLPNPGTEDFLGILSLILWTLTLISLVKYVLIVLDADDHGEGDGALTPSISVLSAVQGIQSRSSSITQGAEAMFADLGHFNKKSIQMAFSFLVYPALILAYAGQAAFLIKNPSKLSTTFYSSCFPRVTMKHTSEKYEGQVYSPEVNYFLMIVCILITVGFKGGPEIGQAYGVAVIWVMLITTSLITVVMVIIWQVNIALAGLFYVFYTTLEGLITISLLYKIAQGGWVPFAITAFFLIITLSWSYGRSKKNEYEANNLMDKQEFIKTVTMSNRVPGICIFCTDLMKGIPPIVRHYVHHMGSLRELMVFVTLRCIVQYGYMDNQNMDDDEYVASVIASMKEIAENEDEIMVPAKELQVQHCKSKDSSWQNIASWNAI